MKNAWWKRCGVLLVLGAAAGLGACEQSGSSSDAGQTGMDEGSKSTYGKARDRAEDVKQDIEDYQQRALDAADDIGQ